jgi:lysozyme family protein
MTDIAGLKAANAARWARAKTTRDSSVVAKRLVAAKAHYKAVEKATGVPWFVIAVIHEREASQSWSGSLAQGDPWNEVSRHIPVGRGPFKSWEDAAVDALVNCGDPPTARWKDWSAGGALTLLETYNGMGYAGGPAPTRGPNAGRKFPPQPSPYIWSGTDQYTAGKYVADKDFRPEVVDKQLGCAGLLKAMMALDPTITFTGAVLTPAPTPKPPAAPPPVAVVASGGFWNTLKNIFIKKG